jgi:hypothetical protein
MLGRALFVETSSDPGSSPTTELKPTIDLRAALLRIAHDRPSESTPSDIVVVRPLRSLSFALPEMTTLPLIAVTAWKPSIFGRIALFWITRLAL